MIRNLFFIFTLVILGACTSQVNEGMDLSNSLQDSEAVETKACEGRDCLTCTLPDGGELPSGQSVESYFSKEIVLCSEQCDDFRVKISCEQGVLSYQDLKSGEPIDSPTSLANRCYKQRCDCSQNGVVVSDGSEAEFFPQQVTSCTQQCVGRKFKCESGELFDLLSPNQRSLLNTHQYSSCEHIPCASCTAPWGGTVAHGASVRAYRTQSVDCGQNCNGQFVNLTCNNGALSGGDLSVYRYASCSVAACLDCQLSPGHVISHGSTVRSFRALESECTTTCNAISAMLTCNNGTLTGGTASQYPYVTCSPKACESCRICGSNVASGGSRVCYSARQPESCGQTCGGIAQRFMCDNGVVKTEDNANASETLLGQYSQNFCNERSACSSCPLPDGRSVVDGQRVTFFREGRLNCGENCFSATNSVVLTCSNGVFANKDLYPEFRTVTCEADCTGTNGDLGIGRLEGEGGGAPRSLCQTPWLSGYTTHKTRLVAFSRLTVPRGDKCSNYKKVIECDGYRGLWSGGAVYIYPTCNEQP
jgi:hypothetical protein